MPTGRRAAALAALVVATTGLTASAALPAVAGTGTPVSGDGGGQPAYTFAVIGDVPYGAAQVAAFPWWIDQINAAEPRLTFHVGDIKSGSTRCDDDYYRLIKADFDRFQGPLVYTPGDNEWTDCHRVSNGQYNPLERLAFTRSVFFPDPRRSLGQDPVRVKSQVNEGFPENVSLRRQRVEFAVLHVVGSNNDLQPWTGIGQSTATPAQVREQRARMANTLALVRRSFADARLRGDRAVVLLQQADMFDPTYTPTAGDISAFQPLVRVIAAEAARFDGPVYLFNGDSHLYNADRPLAAGSPWLATYGVTVPADNVQRVTVNGSSNNVDWLSVTVNRRGSDVLTWQRVPYASTAG
ncbi:MAG TPA: hypothetical protein VES95_09045 [Dermatophilaceae bacterium]|nr:hypothetical protein [Dermatophilaceae bacterium]